MRIQHNIMAMNSYRNYNINTRKLSGNLEKLSSGYKINRAGDDAAGLAISEKMRAQITGLNAATKNVKDGISLVKTAEGAMQEVQDMLNRMDYLATQSANGTYQDEVDRENLQKEVDALKDEINRIADSANFNGIKLLDGSQGGGDDGVSTNVKVTAVRDATTDTRAAQKGVYSVDLKNFTAVATADGTVKIKVGGATVAKASVAGASANSPVYVKDLQFQAVSGTSVKIGTTSFTVKVVDGKITLTMKNVPTTDFKTAMNVSVSGIKKANGSQGNQGFPEGVTVEKQAIKATTAKYAQATFSLKGKVVDGAQIKIGKEVYTFKVGKNSKVTGRNVIDLSHMKAGASGLATEAARVLSQVAKNNSWFKVTTSNAGASVKLTEKLVNRPYDNDMVGTTATASDANWTGLVQYNAAGNMGGGGLTLQIGDTADGFNQMGVYISDMHTSALGIDRIDIGTQAGAASAIQQIKDAINSVSATRGDLGAVQNRLEHTQNNLSVMAENIQDAESTIRDTDVAEEMMSYVKNNILVQSAQAMLAQANQLPQGVLQLLG
ncbi:MAG: flagellin [Lawsonibacter sp.]|nr:flagellin [Lawsonibacter sp.]